MKDIKPNEVYTTKETQDFLKVSKSTLKRFLKRGIINGYKVGGTYRIWGREILGLLSPKAEEKAVGYYRKLKEKTKKAIKDW